MLFRTKSKGQELVVRFRQTNESKTFVEKEFGVSYEILVIECKDFYNLVTREIS